jgi:hypothetical protein
MRRFTALSAAAATFLTATAVFAAEPVPPGYQPGPYGQQPPPYAYGPRPYAYGPAAGGMALVGVLECTGGPSAGYLVGSVTNLNCMLTRNGRRIEPYVAQIRRYGFDVGYTDRWVLAWEVYAPTPRVPPGGLAGNYGGAGASASVGVGAASNQLIGGPGGSLSLLPLEVNGQQGVNLAFGFEGMEIRPAGY